MITFWLFSAAFVVLALLFFWLPYFRSNHGSGTDDTDRNALNVQIFKGRVAELKKELDEDNLDPESFEQLKIELEKNLLGEVAEQQPLDHTRRLPLLFPGLLSVVIPVVAVMLYLQWGSSQLLDTPPQTPAVAQSSHESSDISTRIGALKAELEADPSNAEGWFMLARTYLTLERYQDAYDTFVRLTALVGEHPQILSQQAQSLYLLNNSRVTDEVQNIVDRSLAIDANDPGTLGFLGISSFEAGQYRQAIDHWNRALNSGNPDVNREGLTSAIQQAQAELEKQGESYEPITNTVSETKPGVELSILVQLDESLRAQAKDDATVFVFAQAIDGPKMPLAAVRIQLKDLPATVVLNDSQAMAPSARLSMAEQVQIRAMVSHSGTASTQKGDFYGAFGPLKVAGQQDTVTLTINQVAE